MEDSGTAPADPPPRRRPLGLARLRDALIDRDWLGVVIELMVVIVGILIAFQISEWGEERAAAKEERNYVERLVFETQRGIAELKELNADHDRVIREVAAVFAARDDPVRLAVFSRTSGYGCGAPRLRAAPFNDTASEEMLATGRLNLIASQRLRNDVRDLASARSAAARQVQYGRELVLNQLSALNPYYRFEMSPGGEGLCFIDWRGVMTDPGAVNAAIRAYRVHQLSRAERLKVVTQSERVLRELQCELGKLECKR